MSFFSLKIVKNLVFQVENAFFINRIRLFQPKNRFKMCKLAAIDISEQKSTIIMNWKW